MAASATGLQSKRDAMARVVAMAIDDDADVELLQLMMSALRDLDAPHFATLARIAAAANSQAARDAAEAMPEPVTAALIRHGLVTTSGTMDEGLAVVGISKFGSGLLAYVTE